MKHIKSFESYNIEDIYSWWSGIKVSEDSEYYIIDLENVYLTNKTTQLNKGLKNKTVNFYCKYDKKYKQLKITRVEYTTNNILVFKCEDNTIHIVDTTKPIKISKLHITSDKYNL